MEALTIVVEVILVMRRTSLPWLGVSFTDTRVLLVYVLYNHNKIVLAAMMILFVGEIVMMSTVLGSTLGSLTFLPDCLVASAPSFLMAYW